MDRTDFGAYRTGEARTAIGELVDFSCRPEDYAEVKAFLESRIRTVSVKPTKRVSSIEHGGYGRYSRYDVVQHKYGASDGKDGGFYYLEVLEIRDPPDQRCGFVIHSRSSETRWCYFTEWATLEEAKKAYDNYLGKGEWKSFPGFKRKVNCGLLTPWFYAIGEEELVGDYTFPYGLQDDPVFRFGRRFLVSRYEDGGLKPAVKTCMGTRLIPRARGYRDEQLPPYRMVVWDDGTVWDESAHSTPPVPLEDGGLWITEAIDKFKSLLTGRLEHFEIQFLNGRKFVGRLIPDKSKVPTAEGRYSVEALIKGGKTRTGYVEFKPTPECPNVASFVEAEFKRIGKELERLTVKQGDPLRKGKKWSGVFHKY